MKNYYLIILSLFCASITEAQEITPQTELYRHLVPSKRTGDTVNIAALKSAGLSPMEVEAYKYWRFIVSDGRTVQSAMEYTRRNPIEKYETDSASIITKIFINFSKVGLAGFVFYDGSEGEDEKRVAFLKIQESLKEAKDALSKLRDTNFEAYAYLTSDCAILYCLYGLVQDGQKLLIELDESAKGIANFSVLINQSAFERILLDRIEFSLHATRIDTFILGKSRRRFVAHEQVFMKRFEVTTDVIEYAKKKIPKSSANYSALEEYIIGSNHLQKGFHAMVKSELADKVTTEGMLMFARIFAATVDNVVEDQINAMRHSGEKPYRASGDNAVEIFSDYYARVQADLDKKFYEPLDYRVVFAWQD